MKINAAANPFNSKNGFLPYLVEGNNIYSGYDKIIHHLRSEKVNIEHNLLYVMFNISDVFANVELFLEQQ